MTLMLLKAYPWLLDAVLDEGREKFLRNKKNAPLLDHINKRFFETNIFCRRDIYQIPSESFEQLSLDSLTLDFPTSDIISQQLTRLNI